MVESNPAYNNSVDRIISKEEEREDPRRELQSSFQLESKSVSSHSMQLQSKYSVSTRNPAIPCYSTYRINSTTRNLQEILQLQGSSHARHLPVTVPVSPSILHGRIRLPAPLSTPGPTALQVLQIHKQASSNSTRQKQHSSGSQHPRSPYSSSQANSSPLGITEFYQEKQDSFQKGQVLYIYAILRSGCSKLLIRIILQEY